MSGRSNLHEYASRRDRLALQQTRKPPRQADDDDEIPLRDFVLYIDNEYTSMRALEFLRGSSLSCKCSVVRVDTLSDRPSWMVHLPIIVNRTDCKAYSNAACELYIQSFKLKEGRGGKGFKLSWPDS